MYDLVLRFPAHTKAPIYAVVTAATGTLTYSSATWTLSNNAGTQVASGSATGASGTGTATVTVWKTLDGQDIDGSGTDLASGVYVLHFEASVTGSDSIARVEIVDVVIVVPGTVTHTIYPTAADLQVFLSGTGLISNPPTATEQLIDPFQMIADVVSEWERTSGYLPFLANAVDVVRTYTPPGPNTHVGRFWVQLRGGSWRLYFDNGLVSLTSLYTGVATGQAGTLRTLNTDFFLYPANAAAEGRPYRWAEFNFRLWGTQQSLQVTGKWGFAATLPQNAWTAILRGAAANALDALIPLKFGGLESWTEADVTEKYNFKQLQTLIDSYRKGFMDTLCGGYILETP